MLNRPNIERRHIREAIQILQFVGCLIVSWCVMTFTHESGHIIGGWCSGAELREFDLIPWHLPYSIFEPNPHPLVTLWSGPIFGVLMPLVLGFALRRNWMWFIATFCVLANGVYIALSWFSGDRFLDTTKLLEHGAEPLLIAQYCLLTIGFGYVGFRRCCIRFFLEETSP